MIVDKEQHPTLQGCRAVIIEDEGIIVMQLRAVLRAAGLDVIGAASNGKEGYELVLHEHPEIVLMDVQMPVMDGLEALKIISEQYKTCVIMMTAFGDTHRQRAEQLGACGYIVKPVSASSLLPQIEAALESFKRSA